MRRRAHVGVVAVDDVEAVPMSEQARRDPRATVARLDLAGRRAWCRRRAALADLDAVLRDLTAAFTAGPNRASIPSGASRIAIPACTGVGSDDEGAEQASGERTT